MSGWTSKTFRTGLNETPGPMRELSEGPLPGLCEMVLSEEIGGYRAVQEFPHRHLWSLEAKQLPNPKTARVIRVDMMLSIMRKRLPGFKDSWFHRGKAMIDFHPNLIRGERPMSRVLWILGEYVKISL